MSPRREVTIKEIEKGLDLLAVIIDRFDDVYWPIYERLNRELNVRLEREAMLRERLKKIHTLKSDTLRPCGHETIRDDLRKLPSNNVISKTPTKR